MAIASLGAFEPEDLPGIEPWQLFPKSDISSYGKIWGAVRNIDHNCISPFLGANESSGLSESNFISQTGYDAVGMQYLIHHDNSPWPSQH